MRAEISYDLAMEDDMAFVEGAYRLPGGKWQVFVFIRDRQMSMHKVEASRWRSRATGIVVRFPRDAPLNRAVVQQILSDALNVQEWSEVRGPDSMNLR